jgi:16S rRNA (guanine527-N7)-methyltransferase
VAGDRVAVAIADLAGRYGLNDDAGERLAALLDLVATDPDAPTTVRTPRGILNDHFADSLVALELLEVRLARMIVDIGSGAGFPGLPLAIAMPNAAVTLIDSSARKCAFLERAIAACRLLNAGVVRARVEELGAPATFDLATVRAVASLPVVAEYAAPLLRVSGALVAWRGQRDPQDERGGAAAAAELGLEVHDPLAVRPYQTAERRNLHLMSKVMETPPRFPRRPGMARKRPLGKR